MIVYRFQFFQGQIENKFFTSKAHLQFLKSVESSCKTTIFLQWKANFIFFYYKYINFITTLMGCGTSSNNGLVVNPKKKQPEKSGWKR